jgi:hypothetical protein
MEFNTDLHHVAKLVTPPPAPAAVIFSMFATIWAAARPLGVSVGLGDAIGLTPSESDHDSSDADPEIARAAARPRGVTSGETDGDSPPSVSSVGQVGTGAIAFLKKHRSAW